MIRASMRRVCRAGLFGAAFVLACASEVAAQFRVAPPPEHGNVAFELALRRASTPATALVVLAHPDDEDNGLVAALARGMGARVVVCTATRGEGGQNEIGPELWGDLAVIRTGELLGARRIDGGEQRFLRAIDFGYSYSVDETLKAWGEDRMLADLVATFRRERPDIVVTMWPDGDGGGQHHQTIARLTRRAFDVAATAPVVGGVPPWKAKALWYARPQRDVNGRRVIDPPSVAGAPMLTVDLARFDPVLGATPAELGGAARSLHKSQGFGLLLPLPAASTARFEWAAGEARLPTGEGDPRMLFADVPVALDGLVSASIRSGMPEVPVRAAEARIDAAIVAARRAGVGPVSMREVSDALIATREWEALLLAPIAVGSDGERAAVRMRLARLGESLRQAFFHAAGVRLHALASDGVVVPGQSLGVTLDVGHAADEAMVVAVDEVAGLLGPDSAPATRPAARLDVAPGASGRWGVSGVVADVPTTAYRPGFIPGGDSFRNVPDGFPWWLAFPETAFRLRGSISYGGLRVPFDVPIEYRDSGDVFGGEKRHDVVVTTPIGVTTSTPWLVRPARFESAGRRPQPSPAAVFVASSTSPEPAPTALFAGPTGVAQLAGWGFATVLRFAHEGASTSVVYHPPFPAAAGSVGPAYNAPIRGAPSERIGVPETQPNAWTPDSRPASEADARLFPQPTDRVPDHFTVMPRGTGVAGWKIVEPPHLPRRALVVDPAARWVKADVAVDPATSVGYVMGVGDRVAEAIRALGVPCTLLSEADLASGDLSKFTTIVIGVRAYERRADLRAHHSRIMAFAAAGGSVVVQFQRGEFDRGEWGPIPSTTRGGRVTDEKAPLVPLAPEHRLLTRPNRLGAEDSEGWVQERGLYFLETSDRSAMDVLASTDTFSGNPGAKRGLLTEVAVGKGRWVYCGLALFRQLPAGVPGAYRFLANLVAPLGER